MNHKLLLEKFAPKKPLPQPEIELLPAGKTPAGNRSSKRLEIIQVQDGLSLAEHAVYQALWKMGKADGEAQRTVTAGFSRISLDCGRMDRSNIQLNIRSLIAKGCVSILVDSTASSPKTYAVFGYSVILNRWRAAGYTHVLRNRGAMLVGPEIDQLPAGGTPTGKSHNDQLPAGKTHQLPAGRTHQLPAGGTPTHIGNKKEKNNNARALSSEAFSDDRGRQEALDTLADPDATENDRIMARASLGLGEKEAKP